MIRMKEEMKIKISQNLAYWVGVMQTDGCLYKSKNSNSWNINIDVSEKSLDMLKNLQEFQMRYLI